MSDPLNGFKARPPAEILPNPKVSKDASPRDIPPEKDRGKLPAWIKWVIGCNIVMVHLVVVLVGWNDLPFMLNDAVLIAYIITALGLPVSLGNQTIRNAIAGIFAIKS